VTSVDVGAFDEFTSGTPTPRRVDGRTVVIVRVDDDVYALEDRCSHEEFPLSAGEVDCETREIECERHGAMFSLTSGEPLSLPATKPVATYDVSVVGGRVLVELA